MKLGTIAFDYDFMKNLIKVGYILQKNTGEYVEYVIVTGGNELQLGLWLSFVPDIYKNIAEEIALKVANLYIYEAMTSYNLNTLIYQISCECIMRIRELHGGEI